MSHKSSLGKFKKFEIESSIFSNHNTIRLGINYKKKKKTCKNHKQKHTLLNNQEITEEIKEEIKKKNTQKQMTMETQ